MRPWYDKDKDNVKAYIIKPKGATAPSYPPRDAQVNNRSNNNTL